MNLKVAILESLQNFDKSFWWTINLIGHVEKQKTDKASEMNNGKNVMEDDKLFRYFKQAALQSEELVLIFEFHKRSDLISSNISTKFEYKNSNRLVWNQRLLLRKNFK